MRPCGWTPEFALARAHLAEAWIEMDYGERAKEEMIRLRRSGSNLGRLSRVDRLHVEGHRLPGDR